MDINDFDYDLPEELVALYPKKERSSSRLLVYNKNSKIDTLFKNICFYLKPNDLLIFNDTKVIPANLKGYIYGENERLTKTHISVTLLKKKQENQWFVLCKPAKKVKEKNLIIFSNTLFAKVISKSYSEIILSFNLKGKELISQLLKFGTVPLPPYILKKRNIRNDDKYSYQSIFAKNFGAVAASTASLHFDKEILKSLGEKKVKYACITLHVGGGTFLPIKTKNINDHKMHSEWGSISKKTMNLIKKTKENGGRIIPVGTTSLRILETAFSRKNCFLPFKGETNIFIKPGYKFILTDGLITNFHLPKSTLIILVSAFLGTNQTLDLYRHAIDQKYNFFSYGDCCLLFR